MDRDIVRFDAGHRQHLGRCLLYRHERRFQTCDIVDCQAKANRRDPVGPHRRDDQTDRRGDTGIRRTNHALDAQLARDLIAMHRAAAAGAKKGVGDRITPTLGDVHARGSCHILVDDVVDAARDLDLIEFEPRAQELQGGARSLQINWDSASSKCCRVDGAQIKIRVGHRGSRTATAVADGPWLGAGAIRPDFQKTDLVLARDRAATCTDLDQFDGRDTNWQAASLDKAPLTRGLERVGDHGLAVFDDTQLGRRPSHVEREKHLFPVRQAEVAGCQSPGRRPGTPASGPELAWLPPYASSRRSTASAEVARSRQVHAARGKSHRCKFPQAA